MADSVMVFAAFLFAGLFLFLLFVAVVFVFSLFKRVHYAPFELSVSVVIPVFNEEKNIASCLDSVFASGYPEGRLQVVVVDDGSADNTVGVVKRYPSVVLLRQRHLGKVRALNAGIRAARHDFVVTLDADSVIDKGCIAALVRPFSDASVGATTGSYRVMNQGSLLAAFQNVEYHYNNLIRRGFSSVFRNSIWLFGALACYRKSALERVGFFKMDSLTEDMDSALELHRAGFRVVNAFDSTSRVIVPETLAAFFRQRVRWWAGALQALLKNRSLFSFSSNPSVLFLFVNQFWWSFYALFSLPVIVYQVWFWLPAGSLFSVASYLFRWFSLLGSFYVVYKIPEWGVSFYSIFGVASGLISFALILCSFRLAGERLSFKTALAVFFYFPYTIILNIVVVFSLFMLRKSSTFVKGVSDV